MSEETISIRCTTWNILAQRFWDDSSMEWSERLKLILNKIVDADSDVVCLQEVELETGEKDFSPLYDKYDYIVHKRSKKRTSFIGNMTLWKKLTLSLIEHKFNSTSVHTIFVHNKSSKKFWLSNTHLKAGVTSQEEERINQLSSTFKYLKDTGIPCLITGDFNDDLKETQKMHPLIEKNGFVVRSPPYETCFVKSGWHKQFWKFDHVVTTPGIKVEYGYGPKMRTIPDKNNPSDHFMVNFFIVFKIEHNLLNVNFAQNP